MQYRGRFAPSPTGPLHFGSLVAAAGSYLDARTAGGKWLVRMEDVDEPRCSPTFAEGIFRTLEAYGFEWDGPVLYQTAPERQEAYRAALKQLHSAGLAYRCACSRKEIANAQVSVAGDVEPRYPGTCRNGTNGRMGRAWRAQVHDEPIRFHDRLLGPQAQRLESSIGDFVIRRADDLFAYQLAVVVDDAQQQITHVVRGADLLDSTARQIYLQTVLGFPTPTYLHLPLAVNKSGQKLSKQTGAESVDHKEPVRTLWKALEFLGQRPPEELQNVHLRELWAWAIQHWRPERVRKQS